MGKGRKVSSRMNTSFSEVLKTSANLKTQHFIHFRKEGNRIQGLKEAQEIKKSRKQEK